MCKYVYLFHIQNMSSQSSRCAKMLKKWHHRCRDNGYGGGKWRRHSFIIRHVLSRVTWTSKKTAVLGIILAL